MVKHFPITDMAYSHCFTESLEELDKADLSSLSLSGLFYLYPVINYLEDESFLTEEAKKVLEKHKKQIKAIYKELNIYFSTLNDETFRNDVKILYDEDFELTHNYITAFEKFVCDSSPISKETFLFILENQYVPLYLVLEKEKLCRLFVEPIKAYMISIPTGITYLVSEYDERKTLETVPIIIFQKIFQIEKLKT